MEEDASLSPPNMYARIFEMDFPSDSSGNSTDEPRNSTVSDSTTTNTSDSASVNSYTLEEYAPILDTDETIQVSNRGVWHQLVHQSRSTTCRSCRWLRRHKNTHFVCNTCKVGACNTYHLQMHHNRNGNPELNSPPIASRTRSRIARNAEIIPVRGHSSDEAQGRIDLEQPSDTSTDFMVDSSSSGDERPSRTQRPLPVSQAGPSWAPQYGERPARGSRRAGNSSSSSGPEPWERERIIMDMTFQLETSSSEELPSSEQGPSSVPTGSRRGVIRTRESSSEEDPPTHRRSRRRIATKETPQSEGSNSE